MSSKFDGDKNENEPMNTNFRTSKPSLFLRAFAITFLTGIAFGSVAPNAHAIGIVDDGGANDEVGQNDLTRLSFDDTDPNFLEVQWSWDEPSAITGGGQAVNACAMFDTDADGNVNYSLCVEVSEDQDPDSPTFGQLVISTPPPPDGDTWFPHWIECSDAKDDRCTMPNRLGDPVDLPLGLGATTCSVAVTPTDPFDSSAVNGPGSDYPNDIEATCLIDTTLLPAPGSYEFVNVCSYPSAGNDGNNNPFDCVVTPGSGFLTIVKVANPDDGTQFDFTVNPASNDGQTVFSINGSGTVERIPLIKSFGTGGAGAYSVLEAVPDTWKLESAKCTTNGTDTGTPSTTLPADGVTDAGVTGIDIQPGLETICTFTDEGFIPVPAISIVKTAPGLADTDVPPDDPPIVNYPGFPTAGVNTISYSFLVTNTGNVNLSNVVVTDPLITSSGGVISCPPGSDTLAAATDLSGDPPYNGESTTCTATYTITQNDIENGQVDNTATVQATDPDGNPVTDTDPEAVQLAKNFVLTLVKTATPTTYSAVGNVISYSFELTNDGNATLYAPFAIDDDKSVDESCPAAPTSLLPGESITCTASYTIGQAELDAGSLTNTATGTAVDSNGNPVTSNPDSATVTAIQNPVLTLVKTAAPATYDAVGDVISYSYLVTNSGNVTISQPITIADDISVDESCPLDTGSVTNVATATGKDPVGADVLSNQDDETVTAIQTPLMTIVKTLSSYTDNDGSGDITLGDALFYQFLVTNTGNVTLTNVDVSDDTFGIGVTCPVTTLAPTASTTCTADAPHAVTLAEANAAQVVNTATTTGDCPDGSVDCATDDDTLTTPVAQDPAELHVDRNEYGQRNAVERLDLGSARHDRRDTQ
jgi:hypothetical protein